MLPNDLRLALDHELRGIDAKKLTQTAAALSERYRAGHGRNPSNLLRDADDVRAYAAARMPATYAALHAALQVTRRRTPDWQPQTMLDVGAGTGAASWAAVVAYQSLCQIKLLERDRWMVSIGQNLARRAKSAVLQTATWQQADVLGAWQTPPHDLVTLAYVLGEIAHGDQAKLVERLWSVTNGVLLIVEPGTPRGFAIIRAVRDQLIEAGAQILAPCPHQQACPMRDDDWCHFAQRVERSSLHRILKAGERGFEDEKFSYVAAARFAGNPCSARVLRHPQVQAGRISLELCTANGTHERRIITKRDHDWKTARKLDWGDELGERVDSSIGDRRLPARG